MYTLYRKQPKQINSSWVGGKLATWPWSSWCTDPRLERSSRALSSVYKQMNVDCVFLVLKWTSPGRMRLYEKDRPEHWNVFELLLLFYRYTQKQAKSCCRPLPSSPSLRNKKTKPIKTRQLGLRRILLKYDVELQVTNQKTRQLDWQAQRTWQPVYSLTRQRCYDPWGTFWAMNLHSVDAGRKVEIRKWTA